MDKEKIDYPDLYINDTILAVKIYKAMKITEEHNLKTGTIISDKSTVKVAVKDGYIELLVHQLPGKKKMDVKSLLNGFSFTENSIMR